ncbi:ATP-binding protein [Rhodomicrobium sp. Az07]|uniref:ATP-binding protein n=1 Tax=Rhodomicrobium sp. Az07 TaxID=2839034 RepID=UPI001BE9DA9B|nr:ATP-binding protein [Rhodomicrobium sp. Az07]MBT3070726.1 ATP-binding protein [Rhodomicrobium sp. Az07]
MREIVVISGKGGTGKTSLTASFALLAKTAVLADCDVDAADLHLILTPTVREFHDFWSGHEAVIDPQLCTPHGVCSRLCRFDAIGKKDGKYHVDSTACEGCGVCAHFCPHGAIEMQERLCGVWMSSDTRAGPMIHAKLGVAAENSGKLVSLVRQEARRLAEETQRETILIDGPPGIGCSAIASITGASAVVMVTEPSMSGEHDLMRALELTRHFNVPAFVCINKWDICPEMAARIETRAAAAGAIVLGRVRYDGGVTEAQKQAKAVVETGAPCAGDIEDIWNTLQQNIGKDTLT